MQISKCFFCLEWFIFHKMYCIHEMYYVTLDTDLLIPTVFNVKIVATANFQPSLCMKVEKGNLT